MGSVANPFARGGLGLAAPDAITLSYLTGLPNPQNFDDPQLSLCFKSLLKRDATTREKALMGLKAYVSGLSPDSPIPDEVHLACLQVYVKMAIDVSPDVRLSAHQMLQALYTILGRRAVKYLKQTAGPWLAGTRDSDAHVAKAAKDAWDAVFPGEKGAKAIVTLRPSLEHFVAQVIEQERADTLTDERYTPIDESRAKYARIVRMSLDLMIEYLIADPGDTTRHLLEGPVWVFNLQDPSVDRALLKLVGSVATASKTIGLRYATYAWQAALKAVRRRPAPPALDMIRALTAITKADGAKWDATSVAALAQFVAIGGPRPAAFWPALFNLIMLFPLPVALPAPATSAALIRALEKTVPPTVGPSEPAAWSCLMAVGRRGDQFGTAHAGRVLDLLIRRMARPCSDELFQQLGVRLEDYPIQIKQLLDSRLANLEGRALENACRVLAHGGADLFELLNRQLPRLSPEAIAIIAKDKPEIQISTLSGTPNSSWLDVAEYSKEADTERIVSEVLNSDLVLGLKSAGRFRGRLFIDVADRIDESDYTLTALAIAAHGVFVSEDKAANLLEILAQAALTKEMALKALHLAFAEAPEYCREQFAGKPIMNELFATIFDENDTADEVTVPMLSELSLADCAPEIAAAALSASKQQDGTLSVIVARACAYAENASEDELRVLALVKEDWINPSALWLPSDARVAYPVGLWSPAQPDDPADFEPVLSLAIYLVNLLACGAYERLSLQDQIESCVRLALIDSAAQGVALLAKDKKLYGACKAFLNDSSQFLGPRIGIARTSLWETASIEGPIGFHAAQVSYKLLARADRKSLAELAEGARGDSPSPSYRQGVLARLHAASGPWYDRQQAATARELSILPSEATARVIATLDTAGKTERVQSAALACVGEAESDEAVAAALELLNELQSDLPTGSVMARALAAGPAAQLAVLRLVSPGEHVEQIMAAAYRLENELCELDSMLAQEFLRHASHTPSVVVNIVRMLKLLESDGELVPFVGLEYVLNGIKEEYRQTLFAGSTTLPSGVTYPAQISTTHDSRITSSQLANWQLFYECVGVYGQEAATKDLPSPQSFFECEKATNTVLHDIGPIMMSLSFGKDFGPRAKSIRRIFLLICEHLGSYVRAYYMSLSDRQSIARFDAALEEASNKTLADIAELVETLKLSRRVSSASVSIEAREVRMSIPLDEHRIEAVVQVPKLYPGKAATMEVRGIVGLPAKRRRAWLLEAEKEAQSGAIVGALQKLMDRLRSYFSTIEPCAICYTIVLDNNSLPTKTCLTCRKVYHSDCLFRWFRSNGTRLCPLCRSSM